MTTIPFVKATACGNDFLIIDGRLVPESELHEFTVRICDRHRGVGADGVEWLFETNKADVYARLINSDGSDAEVSGNGTRCVAAWYAHEKHAQEVRILTDAGVKTCTLTRFSGMEYQFRSDMGVPEIAGEEIIRLSSEEILGVRLSTGNPQFIIFADDFPSNWLSLGAELERHPAFPNRTNVEFVKVTGPNEITIRIFERGAGETQSSGTGSCASAVASIYTKRVQSPVRVISPGGSQTVTWTGQNIALEGPASILCRGEFYK